VPPPKCPSSILSIVRFNTSPNYRISLNSIQDLSVIIEI
jgi:hypothetical protein